MSSAQLYDTIGATYTVTRRTEPRIAARVWAALGDASTVLNVGAGTGSYEPIDRDVTAVEPSAVMRAQRSNGHGWQNDTGASQRNSASWSVAVTVRALTVVPPIPIVCL